MEEKIWDEVVRLVRSSVVEGTGPVVVVVKDIFWGVGFGFFFFSRVVVVVGWS